MASVPSPADVAVAGIVCIEACQILGCLLCTVTGANVRGSDIFLGGSSLSRSVVPVYATREIRADLPRMAIVRYKMRCVLVHSGCQMPLIPSSPRALCFQLRQSGGVT